MGREMSNTEQRRLLKAIFATNEIQNRILLILMRLASDVDQAQKQALIEEYRQACQNLQKIGELFLSDQDCEV
jgi:hypothetical protein